MLSPCQAFKNLFNKLLSIGSLWPLTLGKTNGFDSYPDYMTIKGNPQENQGTIARRKMGNRCWKS